MHSFWIASPITPLAKQADFVTFLCMGEKSKTKEKRMFSATNTVDEIHCVSILASSQPRENCLERMCPIQKSIPWENCVTIFPIFSFIQFVFLLQRFSWDFRFCFLCAKYSYLIQPLYHQKVNDVRAPSMLTMPKRAIPIKWRNKFSTQRNAECVCVCVRIFFIRVLDSI